MGQGRRDNGDGVREYAGMTEAPVEADMDDPAVAFAALRTTVEGLAAGLGHEMATIRRGVETALTRFESQDATADYSADLGRIVQQLGTVSERLQAVEQSPVLKKGAEHYALALERGGAGLVRTAVQGMERQAADLGRIGRGLAAQTQSAHDRRSQDVRMWRAAGYGALAGMFLILFVPRFLPFAADSRVAGLVMGTDRVSAGRTMIRAADPDASRGLATAEWMYGTNHAALDTCIAAMFQTRKEQHCGVVLPVVEPGAGR